jgi:DNA-binding CsgD family transcriptional regulator
VPWAAGAIEAALAAGELALAAELCDWLEDVAAPLPCRWPRAIALAGRAGLAAAAGDDARAQRHYAEAAAAGSPAVLDSARVQLRHGAWLRRRKRAVAARPLLAEALHVAEERGAAPLAAQLSAELAAAGGRRRRVREDDGLTPQELRVARLAATGATMREIAAVLQISPRTVETHLAHVYLKLGVASKHELRRRAEELGLRAPTPAG